MAAWLSSLVEASCTLGPQTPRRDSLYIARAGARSLPCRSRRHSRAPTSFIRLPCALEAELSSSTSQLWASRDVGQTGSAGFGRARWRR